MYTTVVEKGTILQKYHKLKRIVYSQWGAKTNCSEGKNKFCETIDGLESLKNEEAYTVTLQSVIWSKNVNSIE